MTGLRIYEHITDSIDFPRFFMKYHMPNTFNSWFLITELHTWMALVKLMEDKKRGRVVRNAMVETLWQDANTRAKELGADNPSAVRAQLIELSEQFQGALIIYDDGLQGDDKVLASAIWERLMDRRCKDYKHLEDIVRYVRKSMNSYDQLDYEELLKNPKIMAQVVLEHAADHKK